MANQPEVSNYDAGVYQVETTDPVQGGVGGKTNAPLLNLSNRTKWLYDTVQSILNTLTSVASLVSPAFTGTPTAPTPASGDKTTKIATTAFVQDARSGIAVVDVSGNANVALTQPKWGPGIVELIGALTGNINVIFPTTGKWTVFNQTTGNFAITCKTAAGAGVVVAQGKIASILGDGTNIAFDRTDFTDLALTGAPTAPTPSAGDGSTKIATTAFVQNALLGHGQCRLVASGGNLVLQPHNGNKLIISGVPRAIPGVGVSLPPTGLAEPRTDVVSYSADGAAVTFNFATPHGLSVGEAIWYDVLGAGNTTVATVPSPTSITFASALAASGTTPIAGHCGKRYYVYAWMNGANMALEASATIPGFDANGVTTKSGDASRTLVGLCRTIAGPAFGDSGNQRFVISYFNRRLISLLGNGGAAATSAGGFTELSTTLRAEFLMWEDETVDASVVGSGSNSTAGTNTTIGLGFDTAGPVATTAASGLQANVGFAVSPRSVAVLGEGYHFATAMAQVSGGTATFNYIVDGTTQG